MKNIKEVLVDATKFPTAIEAKLPEGAPKISTMLADAVDKIPAVPDFPIDVPALPAPPEIPELPTPPGGETLRRYVTGVTVSPSPEKIKVIPSPAVGVIPEVVVRRGM